MGEGRRGHVGLVLLVQFPKSSTKDVVARGSNGTETGGGGWSCSPESEVDELSYSRHRS